MPKEKKSLSLFGVGGSTAAGKNCFHTWLPYVQEGELFEHKQSVCPYSGADHRQCEKTSWLNKAKGLLR